MTPLKIDDDPGGRNLWLRPCLRQVQYNTHAYSCHGNTSSAYILAWDIRRAATAQGKAKWAGQVTNAQRVRV